jgi:para-nitrobenzyl esterase
VRTDKGPVCGATTDGITSYLDIPYAAPPLGDLRWRPPQPHQPWTTTLPATKRLPVCPNPSTPAAWTTEDCLDLEVRMPAGTKPGADLPVMYENHGGGFIIEGRTDRGDNFVRSNHVVYVYVGYRLGILGFLAHKALGAHAGDYGLMDQYAGLRWVRQNIAQFGGNPHNVTIFGESAGGSSECAAMTSPDAKGLFHKAISVSAFYGYNDNIVWPKGDCDQEWFTEAQAQKQGAAYAKKVGCGNTADVAACLRKLPVATLVKAGGRIGDPEAGGTIAPIVNGTTIPMSPAKALATGQQASKVPMILDIAGDEFNGGMVTNIPNTQKLVANTPAEYTELLRKQFGKDTEDVEHHYPLSKYPSSAPYIAYRTAMADAFTVCPMLTFDDYAARHIPLYADVNNNRDFFGSGGYPDKTEPIGAFHSTTNILTHSDPSTLNPNQLVLQRQLLSERKAFVRTGNPNITGTPDWPQFTDSSQPVMSLLPAGDSMIVPASQLAAEHNCGFWSQVIPRYTGSHPWYAAN